MMYRYARRLFQSGTSYSFLPQHGQVKCLEDLYAQVILILSEPMPLSFWGVFFISMHIHYKLTHLHD
jgi:hypothetical protein